MEEEEEGERSDSEEDTGGSDTAQDLNIINYQNVNIILTGE